MTTIEESTTVDERAEFVAGLRAVADWFDANPDVPAPFLQGTPINLAVWPDRMESADEYAALVRALGGQREKTIDDATISVSRTFGPGIRVRVVTLRNTVCEARVVGQREVEQTVEVCPACGGRLAVDDDGIRSCADEGGNHFVEWKPTTRVETVVEDVIEWQCSPVLSAAEQRDVNLAGVAAAREALTEPF